MRNHEFLNMVEDARWVFKAGGNADGKELILRKVPTKGDLDRWTVTVDGVEFGDIITRDRVRFTPRLSGGAVLGWVRTVANAVYRIGDYTL